MENRPLNIGITCYPTIGGSGIVATNLGLELARRGHKVHFISYDRPIRARTLPRNAYFHKVEINKYDLFKYPDYTLPLAVKMHEVHHKHHLNILHVHYAIPHAIAALLAEELCDYRCHSRPKLVTTLHGTDITLLGRDPNLQAIINYSIEKSDGVTAVSHSLARETQRLFFPKKAIKVIYNFYTPKPSTKTRDAVRRDLGVKSNEVLAVHSSNLRPVKRIPDLLKGFARVPAKARLKLLILAGGDFAPYKKIAKTLGRSLIVKSNIASVENYLNAGDLGYYSSEEESFGLGILESMAFGSPIVATRAGGIPEVVEDKKSGLLFRIGDTRGLASGLGRLALNGELRQRMGQQARKRAQTHFATEKIVDQYLKFYQQLLGR